MRETVGTALIATITLAAIVLFFINDPLPQDTAYHLFADDRTWLSIPNFLNVVSNLFYLLVGITGIYRVLISKDMRLINEVRGMYTLLFIGVALVAIGSGYYHLAPTNASLVWDRLPMTIAFMSFFSLMLAEFFSIRFARLIFPVLLVSGIGSVIYWAISEAWGEGDLRLYVLVQFIPLLSIPVLLIFFKARFSHSYGYWALFVAYSLAKLLEHYDNEVYDFVGVISGHSIKHIVSALGVYILLRAFCQREQRLLNEEKASG
jgi:hypothetical protein